MKRKKMGPEEKIEAVHWEVQGIISEEAIPDVEEISEEAKSEVAEVVESSTDPAEIQADASDSGPFSNIGMKASEIEISEVEAKLRCREERADQLKRALHQELLRDREP
jgi:hypothetical protein